MLSPRYHFEMHWHAWVVNCALTRLCIIMSVVAEVAHARDTETATTQQVDFLCLLTVRCDWSSVHMLRLGQGVV